MTYMMSGIVTLTSEPRQGGKRNSRLPGCAHKPQINPERGKASPSKQGLPGPCKGQRKSNSPTTTVPGRTCSRDQGSFPTPTFSSFCVFHSNGYKLTKCSVPCVSNAYVTRIKGSPNSSYLRCRHHWSLRRPRSNLDRNERRDTVNPLRAPEASLSSGVKIHVHVTSKF